MQAAPLVLAVVGGRLSWLPPAPMVGVALPKGAAVESFEAQEHIVLLVACPLVAVFPMLLWRWLSL